MAFFLAMATIELVMGVIASCFIRRHPYVDPDIDSMSEMMMQDLDEVEVTDLHLPTQTTSNDQGLLVFYSPRR